MGGQNSRLGRGRQWLSNVVQDDLMNSALCDTAPPWGHHHMKLKGERKLSAGMLSHILDMLLSTLAGFKVQSNKFFKYLSVL